jgi:hypothetical protein
VVRQDTERAIRAGRNHHVDIRLGEDDTLARYDLYVKLGHGCRSSCCAELVARPGEKKAIAGRFGPAIA